MLHHVHAVEVLLGQVVNRVIRSKPQQPESRDKAVPLPFRDHGRAGCNHCWSDNANRVNVGGGETCDKQPDFGVGPELPNVGGWV